MSEDTLNTIVNGSLEDLDLLIFDIKEAINMREDVEQVIELLDSNGIALDQMKICKKKKPT